MAIVAQTPQKKLDPQILFPTIRGFGRQCGLSEKHVRELVATGSIPYIKHGNRVLIDADGAIEAIRAMAARG